MINYQAIVKPAFYSGSPLSKNRMGGDSNPRYLSVHTLSRRAQSTTLPPIPVCEGQAFVNETEWFDNSCDKDCFRIAIISVLFVLRTFQTSHAVARADVEYGG